MKKKDGLKYAPIVSDSWEVTDGLARFLEILKGKDWWQRDLGMSCMNETLRIGPHWIPGEHTTVVEIISNHVGEITVLRMSVNLFSQFSSAYPAHSITKHPSWQGQGPSMSSVTRFSLIKADLAFTTAESLLCQQQ